MQLLSVNVGRPRLVQHQQTTLSTAIFKKPVTGPVEVGELGLAGDDQADKRVHGGVDKAVYAYDDEDYAWWRDELADRAFSPGTFGENLTTRGMPSGHVCLGDRYRIGTAVLEVTQPRVPCLKLGVKMRDPAFVKRFHEAILPGFYLRVVEPGTVAAGDPIELVRRAESSLSIAQLYRLRFDAEVEVETLRSVAELPALSEAWRDDLARLVDSRSGG
jgi:MOSC domain-containing protein YiiM